MARHHPLGASGSRRSRVLCLVTIAAVSGSAVLSAQVTGFRIHWATNAVFAGTHVSPVPGGGSASAFNVIEPMFLLRAVGFPRAISSSTAPSIWRVSVADIGGRRNVFAAKHPGTTVTPPLLIYDVTALSP